MEAFIATPGARQAARVELTVKGGRSPDCSHRQAWPERPRQGGPAQECSAAGGRRHALAQRPRAGVTAVEGQGVRKHVRTWRRLSQHGIHQLGPEGAEAPSSLCPSGISGPTLASLPQHRPLQHHDHTLESASSQAPLDPRLSPPMAAPHTDQGAGTSIAALLPGAPLSILTTPLPRGRVPVIHPLARHPWGGAQNRAVCLTPKGTRG